MIGLKQDDYLARADKHGRTSLLSTRNIRELKVSKKKIKRIRQCGITTT